MRNFISNNRRSFIFIGLLSVIWLFIHFWAGDKTTDCLKNPAVGQIYIFQQKDIYAPMRLDSISDNRFFMRNYLFQFTDAIPKKKQILPHEFDLNFYAIYEKAELERLHKIGQLVKIYP